MYYGSCTEVTWKPCLKSLFGFVHLSTPFSFYLKIIPSVSLNRLFLSLYNDAHFYPSWKCHRLREERLTWPQQSEFEDFWSQSFSRSLSLSLMTILFWKCVFASMFCGIFWLKKVTPKAFLQAVSRISVCVCSGGRGGCLMS